MFTSENQRVCRGFTVLWGGGVWVCCWSRSTYYNQNGTSVIIKTVAQSLVGINVTLTAHVSSGWWCMWGGGGEGVCFQSVCRSMEKSVGSLKSVIVHLKNMGSGKYGYVFVDSYELKRKTAKNVGMNVSGKRDLFLQMSILFDSHAKASSLSWEQEQRNIYVDHIRACSHDWCDNPLLLINTVSNMMTSMY